MADSDALGAWLAAAQSRVEKDTAGCGPECGRQGCTAQDARIALAALSRAVKLAGTWQQDDNLPASVQAVAWVRQGCREQLMNALTAEIPGSRA